MAIDNTPPRLKLIVTIAAITVITLVAISFATQSYYAYMSDQARHEKIAPTKDKDEQVKAEEAALKGGGMPLDQAMAQIAKGGRPDAITPNASEDLGPMTGWAKLPKPAPVPQPHTGALPSDQPVLGDGGVMLGPDGGVMLGPDGGALRAPTGDAGAGPSDAGAAGGGDGGTRRHGLRPHGGGGNH